MSVSKNKGLSSRPQEMELENHNFKAFVLAILTVVVVLKDLHGNYLLNKLYFAFQA